MFWEMSNSLRTPELEYVTHRRREVLEIELLKGSEGLGFSIAGGIGRQCFLGDNGIYVAKIMDSGAAQVDGRLAVGDKLIAVKNTLRGEMTLENVTCEEAIARLKATPDRVILVIAKIYSRIAAPSPHPPLVGGVTNLGSNLHASNSTLDKKHQTLLWEHLMAGFEQKVSSATDRYKGYLNYQCPPTTETVIRISNLWPSMTDYELRSVVERFGKVNRITFPQREWETTYHYSNWFALVCFENAEDANAAVRELDNYRYGDTVLAVDWAPAINTIGGSYVNTVDSV